MKNQWLLKCLFQKSIILFFAALVLVSCKKEDDDPLPPVTEEDVSFKVELVKIVALDIIDAEGEHLEVYGSVNAKLIRDNITEENLVWSMVDTENISVGMSDYPLSSSVTFTVSPGNVSASTLDVIADLHDYDGSSNADEFLGTETISTPLSNVTTTSTYQMVLDDSEGHDVQLTYSITRL